MPGSEGRRVGIAYCLTKGVNKWPNDRNTVRIAENKPAIPAKELNNFRLRILARPFYGHCGHFPSLANLLQKTLA